MLLSLYELPVQKLPNRSAYFQLRMLSYRSDHVSKIITDIPAKQNTSFCSM